MTTLKPMSFCISLTQHRKQPNKNYDVGEIEKMSQGASFWNIKTDLQPIYQNFNLLAYFSISLNLQLHDVKNFKIRKDENKIIKAYQFSIHNKDQRYYLLQIQKSKYSEIFQNPGQQKLTIKYSFLQKFDWPESNVDQQDLYLDQVQEVNVVNIDFVVNIDEEIQGQRFYQIDINVYDEDNWMLNNIFPTHYNHRYKFGRISQKRKSTTRRNYLPHEQAQAAALIQKPARLRLPQFTTDLEYFYLQPKSQRQKIIKDKHLALALQGGGCKGATYIGAYKAILDSYKDENVDITSVIGSSAGGIIGLAVCCKMSPEGIVELCQKYLSKVTEDKTYPNKTAETQKMVANYFKVIEETFRKWNIVDEQIIEILKNFLTNEQFVDYVFKVLVELSGLKQNVNVLSLFKYENGERNLCGLLNGKLMTGAKVREIAQSCILYLIDSKDFGQKVRKYHPGVENKSHEQRIAWANTLTMKQLYQITGIQFTCTSVDTTNHMLRFFNHKTTPGLPVVNAVQMTGAFPVAFQATYWKKQWGKYYIHYRNMRREVDLEGSKFTDGGMLANFPIDCIDNEDMRPMYFSHVKDQNTIMFGVGLKQIPVEQGQKGSVNNPLSWWNMISTAGFTNLPSLAMQWLGGKFSIFGWIGGIFSKSQVQYIDITNQDLLQHLSQIPLFDFIYNLLMTYTSTKDKLAEQCFRHQSYEIEPSQAVNEYICDREAATQNVEEDMQKLRNKLEEITRNLKQQNQLQVLLQNIEYIINSPTLTTQQELLRLHFKLNTILTKVMFNFLYVFDNDEVKRLLYERVYKGYDSAEKKQIKQEFSQTQEILKIVNSLTKLPIEDREKYEKITSTEEQIKKYFLNRIFFQLELMKNARLFVLANIDRDYGVLKKIARQLHAIVRELYDPESQDPLYVKVREISKQSGKYFIPNQYLKYQRINQARIFQSIFQKLGDPYIVTKQLMKSTVKMLNDKIIYNNSSLTIFKSDPYEKQQMLKVITSVQNIHEVKNYGGVLRALIKDVKNNANIAKIFQTYDQIQGTLNTIVRNKVFGLELVDRLFQVQNCIVTTRIQDIDDLNNIISNFKSCVELVIAYENLRKKDVLSSYIKRAVQLSIDSKGRQPAGFHIVMQSAPFSELYFMNMIQTIKEFKIEMKSFSTSPNTKKYNIPITSITSSNIHSIASILYASDMPLEKKNEYCSQIKDLTYENQSGFIQRIQSRLKSGEWAKKFPILLKDVISQFTRDVQTANIFAETQKRVNGNYKQWKNFKDDMSSVIQSKLDYNEKVNELIEESLSCVIDEIYEQDQKVNVSLDDKLDRIAYSLALKYKKKKYQEQANVKPMVELVGLISHKYVDLLKYLVQNSSYISEELTLNISRSQKKDAWKGLILGEIHSSFKVKRLVQRILEDLGLSRSTTLQEYHQVCSRKMTLNFSVISTRSNCFEFFNHCTRPYLPLWAAVVASSSLIQFFKPVVDRIEWNYELVKNADERKIKMQFTEEKKSAHHIYSADSLRRLPVDLLKNDKMRRKIYSHDKMSHEQSQYTRNEAYLIFDFSHNQNYAAILKREQRNKDGKNIIKVQNMSVKDIVALTDVKGASVSSLLNVPLLTDNSKKLSLYVDSHDQLIINLYKKELIMLPIRLGTLDFHLMCVKDGDSDKLSNLTNDSIMQSYYTMLEKIRIYRNLESYELRPKKYLYIRVQSRNSSEKSKEEYALAVRFLSKLVPNKSFKQNYNLYYKELQTEEYTKIEDEYIRLKNANNLFLRITFVDIRNSNEKLQQQRKVKNKHFRLDLTALLPLVQNKRTFGYVYCLEYTEVVKQLLKPENGVYGEYNKDYILTEETRNIPAESLIVPAVVLDQYKALMYEKPLCDEYHPLTIQQQQGIQLKIYNLITMKSTKKVPVYKCLTCQQNKVQKFNYQISQKYQVKVEQDNSIKCNSGHQLKLCRKLSTYPLSISFAKCDMCSQYSPLGFFEDDECNVDICFACVFNRIKEQI